MKIGYTIWEWGLQSEEQFKSALKDIQELGYRYFENFTGMADLYEGREEEFNLLVKSCELEFSALYHYMEDIEADNLTLAEKYLKFCQKTGAGIMNIQAPERTEKPSADYLKRLSKVLNAIGKSAREYGVVLCLHPHFQMMVEQEDEVDFISRHTEPECVKFCFDTAHMALVKMNDEKLFTRYGERIGCIHLKDQYANVNTEEYRREWIEEWGQHRRFYELGTGDINFKKILQLLKKAGYDGYLIMENDTPALNNYEGAKANLKYLKKLGIKPGI